MAIMNVLLYVTFRLEQQRADNSGTIRYGASPRVHAPRVLRQGGYPRTPPSRLAILQSALAAFTSQNTALGLSCRLSPSEPRTSYPMLTRPHAPRIFFSLSAAQKGDVKHISALIAVSAPY
ncbi:hypothetical protein OF83DRAFT_185342 [Amylostereum chailletii]|nr:hypothetical protein OF83DRAFT_185342 [Amylostereum chailletii]